MRAIILAAGRGSRLNGHVHNGPKALLRVGQTSLVQRQIRTLRNVGAAGHRRRCRVRGGVRATALRRRCHVRRNPFPPPQPVFVVDGTRSAV